MVRAEFKRRMRERILDGAVQGIGRVGLEKLNMQEVGRSAGVSRGTVYRYFPNREALLSELASREGERLRAHMAEAMNNAPNPTEKFAVVVRHAAWHVREHPVLRQLSETDPAFVLRMARQNFSTIRDGVGDLVHPLITDIAPVRRGIVTGNEFVDWVTRMLLATYLFPDSNPERLSRSVAMCLDLWREEPPEPARDG